jgi:4-hydroxy-tetrahydrodipicolinate synthase
MTSEFRGIFTPLITPIHRVTQSATQSVPRSELQWTRKSELHHDEHPDLESLERLVRFQLDGGVHGFWAMGTTSEFAAFDADERAAVIATVVRGAAGRVPVIANISDASTRLAIRHGQLARAAGVDAVAATPPYYFPHSQDELLAHFRALRAAIDLPLFIYNIPQTVRVRVELSTAQALAAEGTVAGIKDSQNDLEWFRQLALFARRQVEGFVAFAGTRYLIDAAVLAGAQGAIPSLANAFPELCVSVFDAATRGDYSAAADAEAQIMAVEGIAGRFGGGGSRNANTLGLLKAILQDRGIIEHAGLTSPLRTPPEEERRAMAEAVSVMAGTTAQMPLNQIPRV